MSANCSCDFCRPASPLQMPRLSAPCRSVWLSYGYYLLYHKVHVNFIFFIFMLQTLSSMISSTFSKRMMCQDRLEPELMYSCSLLPAGWGNIALHFTILTIRIIRSHTFIGCVKQILQPSCLTSSYSYVYVSCVSVSSFVATVHFTHNFTNFCHIWEHPHGCHYHSLHLSQHSAMKRQSCIPSVIPLGTPFQRKNSTV